MLEKNLVFFMPHISTGGVEKNLFIISNFLKKRFKQSYLITAKKEKNTFFTGNTIRPSSIFWEKLPKKFKYLICFYLLIKFLLKNKNTVIFSFQANIYCIIICKIFGVKIVTRSNTSPSGWSKNFIKKKIYLYFLSKADKIIVNSKEFKKEFKKEFNLSTILIYNPLNKKEIIKKSKEKINIKIFSKNKNVINIINVARLTDQKDHITLLKSINLLKKKINLRLLIVGEGRTKNELDKYIIKNNLNRIVKIIKFVKNPYKYISKADLFILSSKFEGLPNVLLESAVLQKPIISSNCLTGPKEILMNEKGGLLFSTGNFKELAKKITFYYHNKKLINKKTKVLYKSLEKYDFNINLKKYYNLIRNI